MHAQKMLCIMYNKKNNWEQHSSLQAFLFWAFNGSLTLIPAGTIRYHQAFKSHHSDLQREFQGQKKGRITSTEQKQRTPYDSL